MLFEPNNFRADPEGWVGNQSGHTLCGFVAAMVVSILWFVFTGEMPVSEHGWAVVALGYLAFELATQGWKGWDTLEDWVFVAVYGNGAAFYTAKESAPGTMLVIVNVAELCVIVAIVSLHFLIGFLIRLVQQHRN